jgi:hypothetical protein
MLRVVAYMLGFLCQIPSCLANVKFALGKNNVCPISDKGRCINLFRGS